LLNELKQLAKEPLIQFFLIGACIYGVYALFGAPDDGVDDRTIVVDANRIQSFANEWQRRWNRPPTREELDGMISAYVREDILYRQAVAMGLNQDDPITRRRLAQKLEFLTNDIALLSEPAEGELESYFQENLARYKKPDLITFSQVYLDPEKRDAATPDDAAARLLELQAAGKPDAATLEAGESFMLQSYFQQVSELEVRRQMGADFAATVMQLAPGQWHGPVLSGYGAHLVYVYSIDRAPPAVFADVRQAVLENWQRRQQEKFNADFFASLRSSFNVEIAEVPANLVLDVQAGSNDAVEPIKATEPTS